MIYLLIINKHTAYWMEYDQFIQIFCNKKDFTKEISMIRKFDALTTYISVNATRGEEYHAKRNL